jgi:GTP cyclohydrolase I
MNTRFDPATAIPDVQSTPDTRHLAIQRVGVKGVRYPLAIRRADGSALSTVGTFNLYVALPETQKGTHMSRFVALLEERAKVLDVAAFREMLIDMLRRLDAIEGHIEAHFPYFISKKAPVSGVESLMDYEATLIGEVKGAAVRVTLQVVVPVTSLCPCSKKISDYGAHNQRSHVTVKAELKGDITIESLIRLIEDEASCELWGLLKRPDEKWVTERAYDNPKFVEDLVRDVAGRLAAESRIGDYTVEAENFESIHNHSAYAMIDSKFR